MDIELRSDFPVTDEACREATGKTLAEWSASLEGQTKRRDSISAICDATSRSVSGVWWATTIWVEHERRIDRRHKDGRFEGYSICSTKNIKAPAAAVQAELAKRFDRITRLRDGKDIRADWRTAGADHDTDVDVSFKEVDGKTAVLLNHNRIQTREEADGLRRAWSAELDSVKKQLES